MSTREFPRAEVWIESPLEAISLVYSSISYSEGTGLFAGCEGGWRQRIKVLDRLDREFTGSEEPSVREIGFILGVSCIALAFARILVEARIAEILLGGRSERRIELRIWGKDWSKDWKVRSSSIHLGDVRADDDGLNWELPAE